jgi:hypothetical protein
MEYRLAPKICEQRGDVVVRLADDLRKCVVYLGFGDPAQPDSITPMGTGFFVGYAAKGEMPTVYLVTAQHVADKIKDCPFSIRYNTKGDGVGRNDHIDGIHWFVHPDKAVDIAVAEIAPPDWADCIAIPPNAFLSEFKMNSKDIGAGDQAYVVGAFPLLHGKHRNLPLVHTGHVALLPEDEPIPVKDFPVEGRVGHVRGYLVQVQTLPGSSGAPVFVRRTLRTVVESEGSPLLSAWLYGTVWLLGVNHGAWYGAAHELLATPRPTTVPVGMAIVMPTVQLLEILEHPTMRERRRRAQQEADLAQAADLTGAPSTTADNPSHKEDFRRLLNAAVRGKPRDDQT